MSYAIADIETRIDKELLRDALYPGCGVEEAFRLHSEELQAKGTRAIPSVPFHVPISIAIGSVGSDHRLKEIRTLVGDDERGMVESFWRIAETWKGCLVTFGGRSFDVPVLELQALKHGITAAKHFGAKYGARYRFQTDAHVDLYDFLCAYGATSIRGGLDVLSRLCGYDGKGEIRGAGVQELWEQGRLDEIHAYCRRDVLSTYCLFLRVQVIRGLLASSTAAELVAAPRSLRRVGASDDPVPPRRLARLLRGLGGRADGSRVSR